MSGGAPVVLSKCERGSNAPEWQQSFTKAGGVGKGAGQRFAESWLEFVLLSCYFLSVGLAIQQVWHFAYCSKKRGEN
jgi:hypothetical protein